MFNIHGRPTCEFDEFLHKNKCVKSMYIYITFFFFHKSFDFFIEALTLESFCEFNETCKFLDFSICLSNVCVCMDYYENTFGVCNLINSSNYFFNTAFEKKVFF